MNEILYKIFTQLINNEYIKENNISLLYNKNEECYEINVIFKNNNFSPFAGSEQFSVDIITPYNSIIIYFKVKHNNGWRSCRLNKKGINEVHYCNSIDDTIEYLKKIQNVINIKSHL